jgi:hypothetical protein
LVIATPLGFLAVAIELLTVAWSGDEELPPLVLEPALGGRVFKLPIEIGPYDGDRLFFVSVPGACGW